jgi:hypothetical protein
VAEKQSKDFYAAGFDALVKRWDKCINVSGGYVEKYMFSQVRISHILRFISHCDLFITLPCSTLVDIYVLFKGTCCLHCQGT